MLRKTLAGGGYVTGLLGSISLFACLMPTFSLKAMFVFVTLAGVAAWAMSRPSISSAVVAMIVAVGSLIWLRAVTVKSRRPVAAVVVGLCCVYLCIADGGLFPQAERYLPTERILAKCSTFGTLVDNGRKRSDSLTVWLWRLCVEDNHKDWGCISSTGFSESRPTVRSISAADEKQSISGVTIDLPVFTVTPVTTVVSVSSRDNPQNRIFFIIGHCVCVIAVVVLAGTALSGRRAISAPGDIK